MDHTQRVVLLVSYPPQHLSLTAVLQARNAGLKGLGMRPHRAVDTLHEHELHCIENSHCMHVRSREQLLYRPNAR